MVIGEKILLLRRKNKISQNELAEWIGCRQTNISNWELGLFEPSLYYLIKLADFFNVSLDELCCRDFKKGEMSNE